MAVFEPERSPPHQMMLSPADITCPKCTSARCRASKWRSRDEKLKHPELRPFRCTDCAHRFLAPPQKHIRPSLLALSAGTLLITMVFVGTALVLTLNRNGSDTALTTPENTPSANGEILRAAQAGDADAQFRVGKNLLMEAISERSKASEALQWLQEAASNGSTEAMVHLGRLYRTGVGALQNYELSAHWLQRAAGRGNPDGMVELGRLYRDGVGLEQDPMLAYVWFNRAAATLHTEAAHERDSLARRLTPEQLKTAQELSAVSTP